MRSLCSSEAAVSDVRCHFVNARRRSLAADRCIAVAARVDGDRFFWSPRVALGAASPGLGPPVRTIHAGDVLAPPIEPDQW
nr:unnamed protein product [Digitaria exilis]